MGQTDKPPSNLPEDSTVDEGAATLDRIERGLKETSRLVGDHLVWETIGDRASERAVEFLLDNESKFVVEYTKSGNLKPKYYDIADSIVIAKAGWELVKQRKDNSS